MPRKIPETRLQALHDALRLLELMTTETQSFDQVADVAARVKWFGMSRLASQLRQAQAWVKDQAAKQRYQLKRHDCPGVMDEQPYRVWFGEFTAWSKPGYLEEKWAKEGRRLARKQAKADAEAAALAADPLGLFYEQHPHLKPKELS